jgi:hypothetical protein
MLNPFQALKSLFPDPPLQVGIVSAVSGDIATISLPDGGQLQARGSASIGDRVFFRNGVIEGQAPTLTYVEVEV